MTASRAELERLTPDDIGRYLRTSGWRPVGDLNGRATIWTLEQDELEVVVPVSSRFRDYPQRVNDVIRTLAEAESRPESQIIHSVTASHVDRQYIRTFPDAPSGMISAADAAEAFQGVRELLIAAAYAEETRRSELVLPRRKPRIVEEFPTRTLVTTGPGSFVIATHIELPRGDTLFPESPFERRALVKLREMLLSTRSAAAEANEVADLSPFTERVDEGISTTLCRGLARLGGTDRDRPVEMWFAWAGNEEADLPGAPIRFEAEQITMLRHAAEDLGRKETTEQAVVHGLIQGLRREGPDQPGWAVVRGSVSSKRGDLQRQVWVELPADDYDRALRAHGQGLHVRAAGVLRRTGRRTELTSLTLFRVLPT
ncbi:hypothetical protein AB0L00_11040 [Actinoallomurus sp. NPDC052308]|uniref:hypothetical protein n=1 Tax=Actinoallomurus sp. NPDC052308 TaxID=3155530 RepID=UPI003436916F